MRGRTTDTPPSHLCCNASSERYRDQDGGGGCGCIGDPDFALCGAASLGRRHCVSINWRIGLFCGSVQHEIRGLGLVAMASVIRAERHLAWIEMSASNFHSHPQGLRFVRCVPSNRRAVEMMVGLVWDGLTGNGWHSWKDADPTSKDCGRWILLNTSTLETYGSSVKQ